MIPFANNDGVKIYYEVEGTGPDLLMGHGFSSTAEDWHELGYVEQLHHDYRLILVDSRGHGRSDKPQDSDSYSIQLRVNDSLAVLDDLGVSKAHYWGFSMAGQIGYCSALYAAQRFSSVVIGGMSPYSDHRDIGDRTPPTHKPLQGLPEVDDPIRKALEGGGRAWLHFWESNMSVPEGMLARLPDNDFQALIAQWGVRYEWRDEIEYLLDRFPFPCLLYAGDAESAYAGMKACAQEMPNAEFVALPGLHHIDIWAKSERIVPHVQQFLEAIENR
ncbi:MAG: alpha/beta hydrolase [Anaerolineales bacterium]|nr:MAG: alpha/beta hydrolase [Anaerolineales bacterium]